MARRAEASRYGFTVPGLRAAFAQHWRALDARWEGRSFGDWAQSAETGQALTVDGQQCWAALFPVLPQVAVQFEGDHGVYEVTADEVVPVAVDGNE